MKTNKELYIVDDSPDHRFIIQSIFSKFLPQYPVRLFPSGRELYEFLIVQSDGQYEGDLPGLIVLDLRMPSITGYNLLKLLRQTPDNNKIHWKTFPIIMMSSEGSPQEIMECYEAGANSFFKKPLEFEEMKSLMKMICEYWLDFNRLPVLS